MMMTPKQRVFYGITLIGGALYLKLCGSEISITDEYQMNGEVSDK